MGLYCFLGRLKGEMGFTGKRESSGDRNLRVRERSMAMNSEHSVKPINLLCFALLLFSNTDSTFFVKYRFPCLVDHVGNKIESVDS